MIQSKQAKFGTALSRSEMKSIYGGAPVDGGGEGDNSFGKCCWEGTDNCSTCQHGVCEQGVKRGCWS